MLRVTPRSELTVRGERLKSAAFLGRDRGTEQILRALGLRCPVSQYRSKLLKMMAFNPENNIDQFIQDCVLEPGKVESLQELREQKRQFERMREMYEGLRQGKIQLEEIERRSAEYENKKRSLQIRELMLSYQELRGRQEEEAYPAQPGGDPWRAVKGAERPACRAWAASDRGPGTPEGGREQ